MKAAFFKLVYREPLLPPCTLSKAKYCVQVKGLCSCAQLYVVNRYWSTGGDPDNGTTGSQQVSDWSRQWHTIYHLQPIDECLLLDGALKLLGEEAGLWSIG